MSDVDSSDGAIAIVGMAGRFPAARNVGELWDLLTAGRDGVAALSETSLRAAGLSPEILANPSYVKAEALLEDADAFDPAFFGYNDQDAAQLDPQHRLFLECAWHALEDAGCVPDTFAGPIGVFAGAGLNRHAVSAAETSSQASEGFTSFYARAIANSNDFLTTRLSYKLDLRGPSVTIQTACSTSLVAIHLACVSLQSCECDLALAGGVSVRSPGIGYLWQEGGIASRDGKCRAFDASATGTVPGSGAAVVALRRLSDALRDRNPIHAVIRGTAVNNDGSRKVGFTAPGIQGQVEVIAMAQAGIDPRTIEMLEAHGTGTELGDAAELAALAKVFPGGRDGHRYCALGSIKSNIGHLDTASGATGLIKAALCLKHRQWVPSLHLRTPCAGLRADGAFYVPTETRPWPQRSWPRRAGVSSFGIGGTNAHAVLEEAPARAALPDSDELQLFPLSARTATAVRACARSLAEHLRLSPGDPLADVARTLQHGRRAFAVRKAFLARDRDSLVEALEQFARSPVDTDEQPASVSVSVGIPRDSALQAAAAQWQQGAAVDWTTVCQNRDRNLLSLPGYPFERRRLPADREARLHEAASVALSSPDQWSFTPAWREMRLPGMTERAGGDAQDWLLVGWGHPIERRLAERLRRSGARVVRWVAGPPSASHAGDASLDLDTPDQMTQTLQSLRRDGINPTRVIYCAGLTPASAAEEEEARALVAQDTGLLGAVALVRAFENVYSQMPYVLLSVTTGAVCTPTDAATEPAHAGLHALGAVLGQEFPNISVTAVDLPLASQEPTVPECYLDWLIEEPTPHRPQALVAYRRMRRLVREQVNERVHDAPPIREIRAQGVYVITGGLGRIGLALAGYLARNHRARLLLLSRTNLPERRAWERLLSRPDCAPELAEKLTRLLEIERISGAVMVASADVSDERAVRRAVGSAREALGPIRGVFHLAADLSDASAQRPIRSLSRADVAAQFRPKVAGFHVLDRVFRGAQLDFGVVFSSNSTLLGGVGLAAYAAANAYLNAATSDSRGEDRVPWIALNWDGWDGEASGAAEGTALTPDEGLDALFRILSQTVSPCLFVSKTDLLARLPRPTRPTTRASVVNVEESTPQLREKRPALDTEYVAPRTELERAIVDVWEEALGIEGIGVQDDLFDLNGDSLRAMSILARMQELFDVEVPLRQFIGKKPTVFRLSMEIATRLGN